MGWRTAFIGAVCTFVLAGFGNPASAQDPVLPRFVEPIPIPSNDSNSQSRSSQSSQVNTPVPGITTAAPPSGNATIPVSPPVTPAQSAIPLPTGATRLLQFGMRTSRGFNIKYVDGPQGQQIAILTGGIKMFATFIKGDKSTFLDVQADDVVVWLKGGQIDELINSSTPQPAGNEREIEVFMSGNVIVRYGNSTEKKNADGTPQEDKTMRADKVYYDVSKDKAIAVNGVLQFFRQGLRDPAVIKAREILQLSPTEFRAQAVQMSSSSLPSDPGVSMNAQTVDIVQEPDIRRNIFGNQYYNRLLQQDITSPETLFEAQNVTLQAMEYPFFYVPYMAGNVNRPLGPLESVAFRTDKIFGTQILTTWSVLDLLAMTPLPGERWDLQADYLSDRGPALGTSYSNRGDKFYGMDMPFMTEFKAYGIYDQGHDKLGGPRENDFEPSQYRSRISWKGQLEVTEELTFMGQIAHLSDPRFLESYYKPEFDSGDNLESFGYLKYQDGIGAVSVLGKANFDRFWVTETNWLPKASGYWLGQSFFDTFTYNAWGSAGYAQLNPARTTLSPFSPPGQINTLPFPYEPTDQKTSTGRFDVMQEISLPFNAGPVKVVPYAKVDLAYYSNDLQGQDVGRFYGGGGVRTSLPMSQLYSDVESELLNLNGLNHKITFGANYFNAWTNVGHDQLPQLDRLNDDATDMALRDIHPFQTAYVPGYKGYALANSPYYDPQTYAVRRLLDTSPDTLDSIQILQLDVNQRWQTKRGYPGMEHTVDWLTLDLSASIFPDKNRDNFGHNVSFLEYDSYWYVGDRTGITSSGWFDPYDPGVSYWNIGTYLNRPDRTSFYIGYRQFDPVRSKALTASVQYVFSQKYSIIASTTYDFGLNQSLSNTLMFSRTGTDLTINFGFNYNAILNNFGFQFEVVPNLLASRGTGSGLFGPAAGGGIGR
ncbi:hypothetical protein KIH39_13130 [Telmatocola sphagniphila]|uniref:LPS-assembly protein LptD n=1 Tax=Telmatocola sphagniphila TaxID=1123043 RepID=A0A8E6EW69_9BACT|nr:hypothetical protein [Telmatocola sphagniphila]QVL29816.1 hypothetical protein KIH39_13130 [Telmatocola sphagniphila]